VVESVQKRAGELMTPVTLKTVAVSPPLTITSAEIHAMIDGMRAGLDAMLERVGPKLEAARV